ncbi:MAG: DegT/DnrJ/EryC1/StrS family aminotransferase [Syntrophobacteraceae bacterium]
MKFIDLDAQQKRIKYSLDQRIQAVLNHGQYINGPEVVELETQLASYVGSKHAVGCASGTDALIMALMAYSVGPGDLIFTTPFTFIATAEVISLLGATPVFVDIDPDTFNVDPVKLENAIRAVLENDESARTLPSSTSPLTHRPTSDALRPKGIIAVDLFGLPADYDRINGIARKYGLFVIEDAAQSFGAEYHGKRCCSLADISCTSFFPAKPLGCYGDGGMCFTDSADIADALRSIRVHGMGSDKYENVRIGINGRLDTIQAAVLLAKFQVFEEEVRLRQEVAARYRSLIMGRLPDAPELILQQIPTGLLSVWAQYSILAANEGRRTAIQNTLKEHGIPTAIYYPKPLHLQQALAYLGYREGDFPVSENRAKHIFSIPMHAYLNKEEQKRIVDIICRACDS